MSDEAVIYIALFIGFVLLLIIIRFLPFGKLPNEKKVLMYYKLDIPKWKITTISAPAMEEECKELNKNDYDLIFFTDLEAFTNQKVKLPDNSFLIVFNETYSNSLKMALPILLEEHISIIIFLPIIVSPNINRYQEKSVQQLNEFIFSEDFKKKISVIPNQIASCLLLIKNKIYEIIVHRGQVYSFDYPLNNQNYSYENNQFKNI